MRTKVMAYNLKDFIRKEKEPDYIKRDDIGTKPIPRWIQDKNAKNEIEKLF
jgi:hypothetical protein